MLTAIEAPSARRWVSIRLREQMEPAVGIYSAATLNDLAAQWPTGETGELLVFRPGQRMFRTTLQVVTRACKRGRIDLPEEGILELSARAWICGNLANKPEALREMEFQVAAVNQSLAKGAAPADSGIRLRLLEARPLPERTFERPQEIDCFLPLADSSGEGDTIDIYLHPQAWAARACPLYRRIFIGYPRLQNFTLAHEIAHLLGMPQRAHVDDNRYLERGNVMDATPTGGRGALTLGQLCIFNLHLDSLAARIRARRERRFPLRRMIDHRGEAIRGPSLGLHFPKSSSGG